MTTLKFADTHNMVVFLSKPTESDGLEKNCKNYQWEEHLHALVDGKKIIITESSVRRDLQLADEEDKAVHKELDDSLVRAATTASSLEAEQDSGNINKTQSKETPNESSSLGTTSGGGPKCQETMGDTIAQTKFESYNTPILTNIAAKANMGFGYCKNHKKMVKAGQTRTRKRD
ncbi:hypothetical protein Tco_0697191 [Tanacetum coccineum]